ncbi:hypothetical protein MSPP1_001042 [Malassezia sp. CBS 17886]|nr:hypothetical protein MSPP1_001042 [Malassezia sp. CBS 17886]
MADVIGWLPGLDVAPWWDADGAAASVLLRNAGACREGSAAWLCGAGEGFGPVSPTRDFDLTPCFQAVVLWMLPCVVFTVAAVFSLRRLIHMPVLPRSPSSLTLLHEKDVILGSIVALALCEFVALAAFRAAGVARAATGAVSLLADAAGIVAYVAALMLVHANHLRERRSSDGATLLWTEQLLVAPMRMRTLLQTTERTSASQSTLLVLMFMRTLFVGLALLLECMGVERSDEGSEGSIALPESDDEGDDEVRARAVATRGDEERVRAAAAPVDVLSNPPECPYVSANLYSRLLFLWMQPLMSLGARKYLTDSDMWALPAGDDAESIGDRFQTNWDLLAVKARMARGDGALDGSAAHDGFSDVGARRRFWRTLFRAYGSTFMLAALFKVVQDSLAFVQPQLLRALLAFVGDWERTADPALRGTALRGYVIALLLFFAAIMQMMCLHQYFQLVSMTGMRARGGVTSALFRKTLRLSNEARAERATGDIVNLMSVDANRLPDFLMYAHILWSAVFQITIAFVSLYNLLGWSAFVGVGVMIVSLPLNTVLATYLRRLSAEEMKVKDRRTGVMNEIIVNIKSIKLFAWEPAFTRRLLGVRNGEELPLLRRMGIANSGFNFFWMAIPFFVSLATFVTFSMSSSTPLTADIVFPALSLYQLLNFPLTMLAGIVSMLLQTQVSATRLAHFLDAPELDEDARVLLGAGGGGGAAAPLERGAAEQSNGDSPPAKDPAPPCDYVVMRDASFAWTSDQRTPTLRNLSLSLRAGELVAVLGRVGSGKSSLLAAILGEMIRTHGLVTVRGQTAYFSQGGWCIGASIRENILFGRAYDAAHYRRCVAACALEPDLAQLGDGDMTEIGERGVSLSGGQRARVALARACYAAADVYLLDDPLAAVDAHVGAHLWKHVIGPTGILAGTTRVLTTNAVSYLSQCDMIFTICGGELLDERGSFDEVMAARGEVHRLITLLHRQGGGSGSESAGASGRESTASSGRGTPSSCAAAPAAAPTRPRVLAKDEVKIESIRQLRESTMPKEAQETGNVKWTVYRAYFQSAGGLGIAAYIAAQLLSQGLALLRDLVLKMWSSANSVPGGQPAPGTARYYLTLYSVVGFTAALGVCVSPFILYVFLALRSSRKFHDGLFKAVMRYPLQWFETTPTGRLMNLFSRDVSVVDEVLPRVIHGFVRSACVVLGMLCVVTYTVPAFLLFVFPLALVYRRVMLYYLASSRELKRLDAVSKSPIFTWFQESLDGLAVLRAFRRTDTFTDAFDARVDRYMMCYFPAFTCNRWLAVRIEFLGAVLIFFSSSVAVFTVTTTGGLSAGLLGLMLSQVLNTTQTLNWTVRSASEVEQNIVSVERIVDYSHLPEVAPYHIAATEPRASWPERGVIEFRKYSTRYRAGLPLVLRDVSFTTGAKERIGVVGRTGAGKSSLTLALFRILERTEGSIYIDGVDIATLGLGDLRQRLSIIPQDAQLWQGTLRQNLDPLFEYDSERILHALDLAHLGSLTDNDPKRLDMRIAESGANLSSGQRQLLCIARAILRRSRVLVLDEATSSIDLETDGLIQRLVRTQFDGTTITIAHRLNTILDSDRVLVLKDGAVQELDKPSVLLARDGSAFQMMAREAGLDDAIDDAKAERMAGVDPPRRGGADAGK